MSALQQLQKHFQAYLLTQPNSAITHVVDAGKITAEARLQVYAEAYRLRLLEALETDFVALRAYLGADEFSALGDAYIATWPSAHYSIRYFGGHMAEFLAETPPYANTPLLAELAAFDWALSAAFDAADDPVLAIEDMSTIAPSDWPNLTFRAHAAVIRLDLQWNAPTIWSAADSGAETLPAAVESPTTIPWVIWRQNLQSFYRSMGADEAYALDALLRGESFGSICEGLCEWAEPDEVAAKAASFLKQWIADGMLREFSV